MQIILESTKNKLFGKLENEAKITEKILNWGKEFEEEINLGIINPLDWAVNAKYHLVILIHRPYIPNYFFNNFMF